LLDPRSDRQVAIVKMESPNFMPWPALLLKEHCRPVVVSIYEASLPILMLHVSWGWVRRTVTVVEGVGNPVALLRSKFFSARPGFRAAGGDGRLLGDVEADMGYTRCWIRGPQGKEIARMTERRLGDGPEFVASSDHYLIEWAVEATTDRRNRAFAIGAAIAIVLVLRYGAQRLS
jgi:hypothetical protein